MLLVEEVNEFFLMLVNVLALKAQCKIIGQLQFILLTNVGQYITRVAANCC